MGAAPGVAEIGAGAGVAAKAAVKVAVKIAKEAVKGVAEMAAKTPGKMVAAARRGLAHPRVEGPVVFSQTPAAESVISSLTGHAPEAPAPTGAGEAPAATPAKPDVSATAAQTTDKDAPLPAADAAKVSELVGQAKEMATAAKARGETRQAANAGSAEPAKPGADTVAAGTREASQTGLKPTEDEKQGRPSFRTRMSREYRQAMKRLKEEALARGEDIEDPKAQERMQSEAADEFYNTLAGKTELTKDITEDTVYKDAYDKALADATAKFQDKGEKTDSEVIRHRALRNYLANLDKAPFMKKAERWIKKHWKSLLTLLIALVGGTIFKTAEEGTAPARKPNG